MNNKFSFNWFKNSLKTIDLGYQTISQLLYQSLFYRLYINKFIESIGKNNLPKALIKKMKRMGMDFGILANYIAFLRGYGLSRKERKLVTLIGTIAVIYDCLFDDFSVDPTIIKSFLYHTGTSDKPHERLLMKFSNELHELMPIKDNAQFYKTIDLLHLAQIKSLEQKQVSTEIPRLIEISKEKGAYSALILRQCLKNKFLTGEYETFYNFGELLQLVDDSGDIAFDQKRGVRTFATAIKDSKQTDAIINSVKEEAVENFMKLEYPQKNIDRFLFIIEMGGKLMNMQLKEMKKISLEEEVFSK